MSALMIGLLFNISIFKPAGVPAPLWEPIVYHSSKNSLDPYLVASIARVESGFRPYVTGKTHKEVGLMQLNPAYFNRPSYNVDINLAVAVKYLKVLKTNCKPKYGDAWFICYNLGPNKKINSPKEFPYYRKVKRAYEEIQKAAHGRRVARHNT